MKNFSIRNAAELVWAIGDKCNSYFGKDETQGSAAKAKKCLKEMGYRNVNKYIGYKEGKNLSMLRANKPVYISATKGFFNLSGHAWVIDGFIRRERAGSSQILMHCNYGWGGKHDGYYASGVFKMTSAMEDHDPDIGDYPDNDDSLFDRHYSKYYRILTYDRP